MSDLISRSELLKEVEKYKFGAISNDAEREYIKKTILDFIICHPTAYDIGNVVEELEKREEHYVEMLDWQGQSAICDAIEIVKHGGVSDDVCEWKRDDMCDTVYKVCGGCFTSEYQKDFKYCPYCGKKINVVE